MQFPLYVWSNRSTSQPLVTLKEHLVSECYENLIKLIDKAEEKHLKRD